MAPLGYTVVAATIRRMKAAVFESAGSPLELVRLIDVDVPVPRHETLVKVDASPI